MGLIKKVTKGAVKKGAKAATGNMSRTFLGDKATPRRIRKANKAGN